MERTWYTYWESPVGRLLLAANEEGLQLIGFPEGKMVRRPESGWQADPARLGKAIRQLKAYFAGKLREFDLELALRGTPFQLSVWRQLQAIPYGATVSYGEIARRVGNAAAVRAVGAANGRNPLPIVIPCHRVIGSDGRLTGYGGGLHVKEILLVLERKYALQA